MSENISQERAQQQFPIVLKAYDPAYPRWFSEEKKLIIRTISPENVIRFNHIGSTAVPGLPAKPVIDMLLEIPRHADLNKIRKKLAVSGYRCSPRNDRLSLHRAFWKETSVSGNICRIFHLHLRYPGDWNELYFRDYLRRSPDIATAYARLKQRLCRQFAFDCEAYARSKEKFMLGIAMLARLEQAFCYAI